MCCCLHSAKRKSFKWIISLPAYQIFVTIRLCGDEKIFISLSGNYAFHSSSFFFFNLITTHWRAALLPAQLRTAKRGLSGFIFDSRPAYPWRRGAEFELAVGGVGVLSTRAGGGGGWEEEKPETLYTMYEGGTTVAPHWRPPPFQVQEEVSTTLAFWAPSALKNKDIQQNSNVRSTITLHLVYTSICLHSVSPPSVSLF